jgi:2-desacetyl-2-hydroxyethyl bacteriochlorophyllide A dehydrogenase
MKALFYDGHLSLKKTEAPVPCKNEALIKVLYAGICRTDIEITEGYMNFEGILGHEFVGRVEFCENKDWIGKRVVGEINIGCDDCSFCRRGMPNHCPKRTVLGIQGKNGTFAEYMTLPWKNLHEVPPSIKDEEAVFTEPLAAACRIPEQINITKNDRVLILGDGKLGLLIGQVLLHTGCDLLCAGKHPKKLSLLSSMGISTQLESKLRKKNFDIVIEASGHPHGLSKALHLVRPEGTIILKSTYHSACEIDTVKVVVEEIKLVGSRCGPFPPAIDLLQSKKVSVAPLISKTFPLEESLEAFRTAMCSDSMKILLKP